ncbi:MAG: glycosyltransferase [Deltaproteobacteria bacterium]|nr:glycosyltransferase [Deltaproteobacteria bacterium]
MDRPTDSRNGALDGSTPAPGSPGQRPVRPTQTEVSAEVDRVIARSLGVDPSAARGKGRLDLAGFDSIDLLDSVASLEGHFDIEFAREELARVTAIEDLYALVWRKHVIEKEPLDKSVLDGAVIVIPTYNHATRLGPVLERSLALGVPVIVVDDGSTDGIRVLLERYPALQVIRHERNLGKGAALRTGLTHAAKVARYAITLDADGQHEPLEAVRLLAAVPAGTRPIVIGLRQGMEEGHVPWTSRFGRSFSNFWVRLSGGGRVADSQCGYRAYPLPETLSLRTRSHRFNYEVELLALAGWAGIPVLDVPISVVYQPGRQRISHFRPFVDFCRNSVTFFRLIALRLLLPRAILRKLAVGR